MQRTFEVTGPVELDIRLTSGEIEVDPTLDGRVEIELTAHDEESQRLVDEARVELQEHAERPRVIVDVPQRRGGGFSLGIVFGRSGVSCRVRCPKGSLVGAKSKSADLLAHGIIGGLTVQTASGDVEVDRVLGNISVKSASGDLEAREVSGGVSVQTASGDIAIEVVRGPVSIATASGDVSIREAYDNVSANTVSGDQDHGAVMTGHVAAHSVSGDVRIGVRRGSRVFLDCNTVSGETSSELDLTPDAASGDGPLVEIRAKTVSGDIKITRAAAAPTAAPTAAPSETDQDVHA
jgi:Putative adhesin